jgi:hypothetical protein
MHAVFAISPPRAIDVSISIELYRRFQPQAIYPAICRNTIEPTVQSQRQRLSANHNDVYASILLPMPSLSGLRLDTYWPAGLEAFHSRSSR